MLGEWDAIDVVLGTSKGMKLSQGLGFLGVRGGKKICMDQAVEREGGGGDRERGTRMNPKA